MVLFLPPLPLWIAAMLLVGVLAVRAAVPRGRRWPRPRTLMRALIPPRILRSRSGRLDIAAFLFSVLLAGLALGWALVSADWWAAVAQHALVGFPVAVAHLPRPLAAATMTLALFVVYEFAYWLNHWLSHRVGWLWAFHKVHHSAESLSLLTNFRVHPVDTILFANMVAAMGGVTAGILRHAMGPEMAEASVSGTNVIVFLSSIVLSYLQHSHLWMATTGRWGRLILSPAHHQLHHSTDPAHHNTNLGSTIGLFDWAFGTLLVPTKRRQPLRFGVDGLTHDPHGLTGALLIPFVEAARDIAPSKRAPSPARRPAPADRQAELPSAIAG